MEPTNGFFVYSYGHDDDMQGWTDIRSFRYLNYDMEEQALDQEFIEKLVMTLKECGWGKAMGCLRQ
jgi:hypothetical protein